MNMILLYDTDFIGETGTVRIFGRRFEHINAVIKPSIGDTLKTGLLNGKTGTGIVTDRDESSYTLKISLNTPPPSPLPVTLIIALPRPKVIKRVIQSATVMGVKKILLINAWRVEKSFWQSPVLAPENMEHQLVYGLEQAKDTVLPEIKLFKGFKPFVEKYLPDIVNGSMPLVAHPVATHSCPRHCTGHVTLAIGPEGGFIPYEIDKFVESGFTPVHLGDRTLKVETVIPMVLGRLF